MKRLLLFILFFNCLLAVAQTRLEKRVYYLDCSQTMLNNDLWNRVKKNLKEAISKIEDDSTEVEVVLFAYDLSHNTSAKINRECKQISNSDGKRELIKFIDGIPAPQGGKENTYTFHDVPLIDFCNYRINEERDNYFYLMTDGLDEYGKKGPSVGTKSFDDYIEDNWGKITKNKNVFGFYVMLNGKDKKRYDLCNNTNYLWYIETADVNVNTIRASIENGSGFPMPIKIKLTGKKNLNNVVPTILENNSYYKLSDKYENGIISLLPSIKSGIIPKNVPATVKSKVILSTPQGPFDKQFNIIVDEVLEVDINCFKNPIAFDANNSYNVRASNYFELSTSKGNLSNVESVIVRFEDSLSLDATTEIKDNKLIVYPMLKDGKDSTYYINKFIQKETQDFKIIYSIKSNDPLTYIEGENSVIVKFEGKWEKWLNTSIEACDKSRSFFSVISSWLSSDKESSLGTVSYYPGFLWKGAKTTESQANWKLTFTKDALGIAGTMVKLEFCSKTGTPLDTTQYKIYVNDKLCEGNKFEVTNEMTQQSVKVWMKPGTSSHAWWGTDEFEGNLKVITFNNLIGINKCSICEGTLVLPWTITYQKNLNPIIVFFLWLLFYLFLLWLALKALLRWRANNSPKFPNDMWVHIRPGSGFDPTKDRNVHFEGKSIFNGSIESVLTIDNGNSINTNVLSDLFIKELVVLKPNFEVPSQRNWDRKFNGEIISVNCEFFNDYIEKIIMTPLRNSIVVTIYYSEGCGFEKESFEINIQDRTLNRKDTDAFAIPNSKLCIQGRIHTDEEVD